MACCEKYKPCILKYKALILKYVPYIFDVYKTLFLRCLEKAIFRGIFGRILGVRKMRKWGVGADLPKVDSGLFEVDFALRYVGVKRLDIKGEFVRCRGGEKVKTAVGASTPSAIVGYARESVQSFTFFFAVFDSLPMRLSDVTTYV